MTSVNMVLDEKLAEAAVLGGAVLGGGGGGAMEKGIEAARLAVRMGDVELVPIESVADDRTLLTVSSVGAPAAKERYVRPADMVQVVELFQQRFGVRPDGLITNECGGNGTVNGWLQSAVLGIPLVDAPCNGRAHPTGIMGSIGLHKDKNYISRQTAIGGNSKTGRRVELAVSGTLETAAGLVRNASVLAGGLVTVARNPVPAGYARRNAAHGAVRQSIGIGQAMLTALERGPIVACEAAAEYLHGDLAFSGRVSRVDRETRGGFDVGLVVISGVKGTAELTFWNEYMTLEVDGQRLATFPDLLTTFNAQTGKPVSTADVAAGMEVVLLRASKEKLFLGAGMRDPELFRVVEEVLGKQVISYVF